MALLRRIEMENDDILVTLHMTKNEYESLGPETRDFILLPTAGLNRMLITGRLGNGNRIMVPSKFLKNHDVPFLRKIVPSTIVGLGKKKFLIIELENRDPGIPVFGED